LSEGLGLTDQPGTSVFCGVNIYPAGKMIWLAKIGVMSAITRCKDCHEITAGNQIPSLFP